MFDANTLNVLYLFSKWVWFRCISKRGFSRARVASLIVIGL